MTQGQWYSHPFRWFVAFVLIGLIAVGVGWVVAVGFGLVPPLYWFYPGVFFFPFFFPFAFFFVLFLFFVLGRFFRPWRSWGSPYAWHYGDSATEILRRRYAQGEITREQFEQMIRDLGSDTSR